MKTGFLGVLLLALAGTVPAGAGAFSDKLAEVDGAWLIGTWAGADSAGTDYTVTYAEEFGGQAGSVWLRSDEIEVKGLIGVDPASGQVREVAVTSIGAIFVGTWDGDESGLTFRATWTLPDGSSLERIYVHRSVDRDTMRVVVYDGPVDDPASQTVTDITLRRQAGAGQGADHR